MSNSLRAFPAKSPPPTVAEINAAIDEVIKDQPGIRSENPSSIILYTMGRVMAHFKGTLNPIKVRPLVTLKLLGHNAAAHVARSALADLAGMREGCFDDPVMNKILDEAETAFEAIAESKAQTDSSEEA